MQLIRHELIEGTSSVYSNNNYSTFNYSNLINGCCYREGNDFFGFNEIRFVERIGCKRLEGKDLLYYPTLAKHLRNIQEYPTLKREYKVNQQLTGIDFLSYFGELVKKSYANFNEDLLKASQHVNHLIYLYGYDRYIPIINGIENHKNESGCIEKKLIINHVPWFIDQNYNSKRREIDYLDLHQLLNIKPSICCTIKIENYIHNSPFLALRFKRTWKHTGHVKWYDLNTLQPCSKKEAEQDAKRYNKR